MPAASVVSGIKHQNLMKLTSHNNLPLTILLLIASVLLIAGFIMPMMTITKLVFFSDRLSLLQGIYELYVNGNYFLFVVVAGFSVVLPVLKIIILFRVLTVNSQPGPQVKRLIHLMHEFGRWAMLDVMVVAVLIMTVKLGAIASIEVHAGLYVFGIAVLLIMFITNKTIKITRHIQAN